MFMFMNKIEACKLLDVKRHTLNNLINSGMIKSLNNQVEINSVYEYKKELEERRNTNPAKWIYRNEF